MEKKKWRGSRALLVVSFAAVKVTSSAPAPAASAPHLSNTLSKPPLTPLRTLVPAPRTGASTAHRRQAWANCLQALQKRKSESAHSTSHLLRPLALFLLDGHQEAFSLHTCGVPLIPAHDRGGSAFWHHALRFPSPPPNPSAAGPSRTWTAGAHSTGRDQGAETRARRKGAGGPG
jgi:hypothetical protein